MASVKPGFDAIGNRRNSRVVPSTDNDTARRLKFRVTSALVAFFAPDGVSAGAASEILTAAANAANAETVTIDAKVYTFQDTLTNVDGNVHIGVAATNTLDNLIAAINLGAGAGTDYATAMTLHPTVSAVAGAGDTMDASAKTGGTAGNSIATTEAAAQLSWGDTTMSGGLAAPADDIAEFESGDALEIAGSGAQDGTYVIDTVVNGQLTLVEQTITAEAVGASVTLRITNNRNLNRFAA